MPDLGGGLSGLGMYGGFLTAEETGQDLAKRRYENQMQQMGDIAFGRTLAAMQQMPMGGQPQPGMQPGMGAPMPPQGQMPQGMPPGGAPGAPGGAMPPPRPQQPMPQAPMGGAPMPAGGGMASGMGMQPPALNWQVVLQKVQEANPGAPPQVIAQAVDRFMPLMNQQNQQQWREMSLALREQGLQQQRMLGEQRLQQGEERISQAGQRVEQAQQRESEREREFDIREKRIEANNAVKNDQGYQRLTQQRQALEQRIIQGNQRNLISQWRAVLDAEHKRAMEIIQSSSAFSALTPEDRKKLLDDQNKAYGEAIERMRGSMGSSTPTGGTSATPQPKTQSRAPETGATPDQPARVNTPEEAEKLPAGTRYVTPDGQVYTR